MDLNLKTHIVAFIDILGFSEMVSHDCEKPNGEQKYIGNLFTVHRETKEIAKQLEGMTLTQFSDSVVISVPYSPENFHAICGVLSSFQYRLLCSGILCRGGVSYGKHFSTEDFLFSHGLIDAYNIESNIASTPRIVLANGLVDLVFGRPMDIDNERILTESDGLFFIDYLAEGTEDKCRQHLENCLPAKLSENSSVRSKQIWLIDYFNFKYPNNKIREISRFEETNV